MKETEYATLNIFTEYRNKAHKKILWGTQKEVSALQVLLLSFAILFCFIFENRVR
jgi:hypothetical protein